MDKLFNIIFLEDAYEFLSNLDKKHHGLHYRLFAFWDKTIPDETLVISTHGLIKKRSRVPEKELIKANQLRSVYFADKEKSKTKKK